MAKVTYIAPKGDNKVAATRGIEFFDGQTKDLDDAAYADLIAKARNHPHFIVDEKKPDKPKV